MNDENENEKTEAFSSSEPGDIDKDEELLQRRQELLAELSQLVSDLKTAIPESDADAYSPLLFLTYIRRTVGGLTPERQLGILESFAGLTREDLMDIETWKGMAYMMSYSALFQAGQVKDKMNESMPPPLQPDTSINIVKEYLERFTPEIAKNILKTFAGATREDLMDLDTWKGVWTMLTYSIQFQMNSLWNLVLGNDEEEYL